MLVNPSPINREDANKNGEGDISSGDVATDSSAIETDYLTDGGCDMRTDSCRANGE